MSSDMGLIDVQPKVRILTIDDYSLMRESMAEFLNLQDNLHLCCQASNTKEALGAMSRCKHSLAIVDISLDGESGLELINCLRQLYPTLAILTLSLHHESLFAERALRAGADGYLMKQEGAKNILLAIQQILAKNAYFSANILSGLRQQRAPTSSVDLSAIARLSERELEILQLIGLGFSTFQIAEKLNRSPKTIGTHRAGLKRKLQVKSKQDLLRFAAQVLETV